MTRRVHASSTALTASGTCGDQPEPTQTSSYVHQRSPSQTSSEQLRLFLATRLDRCGHRILSPDPSNSLPNGRRLWRTSFLTHRRIWHCGMFATSPPAPYQRPSTDASTHHGYGHSHRDALPLLRPLQLVALNSPKAVAFYHAHSPPVCNTLSLCRLCTIVFVVGHRLVLLSTSILGLAFPLPRPSTADIFHCATNASG